SYKELYVTTFDPAFATAIGMRSTLWHYSLMGATSFTTVAAFEVVGAILVVALLVAPPATAYLLTQRLHTMLVVATLVGILSAVGGYYLAVWVNGSIAGGMATVAGGTFLLVFGIQQWKQSK
ncbi:MAG: metal ABC transporter permease, partial [Bacteroidota bacterium]